MALGSPLPSGHFSFLYCRMLFEPNDTRSKILKCWCPRFARLQFQTRPRFGSHPNWFTGVLSKNILLNVWIGIGILFRACKSALIVPWVGHANFHLCLGHCSSLSSSICFPSLIILLLSFLHKTTNDLGHAPNPLLLMSKAWWGLLRTLDYCISIQKRRGKPQKSILGTNNT